MVHGLILNEPSGLREAMSLNDGTNDSPQATVEITVSVDRAPQANPQTVTTNEGVPVLITLTGSDPEGDPLNYTVETPILPALLTTLIPLVMLWGWLMWYTALRRKQIVYRIPVRIA